jgi:hypothetical protein
MKKALISPNEQIVDQNNNVVLGVRVAEVVDSQTFEVCEPLFWTDCNDEIVADKYFYNMTTSQFEITPLHLPTAEENKQQAIGLLQQTDWTTIADVADPALSNPYLTNQLEFIQYRNLIRPYTINPVSGNLDWGVCPTPIWSA